MDVSDLPSLEGQTCWVTDKMCPRCFKQKLNSCGKYEWCVRCNFVRKVK